MKILLLYPEDKFPLTGGGAWDLVIDLARAPHSTYEQWSRETNCPVISLYDFAEEIEDLHHTRELLQFGMGQMVDEWGIDWWDVMSLMIVPELQQLMLLSRLAKQLPPGCELHSMILRRHSAKCDDTSTCFQGSTLLNYVRSCWTNLILSIGFDAGWYVPELVRESQWCCCLLLTSMFREWLYHTLV